MDSAAPLLQSESLEDDALASLEDRIRRAVDLVATLRGERDSALAEVDAARKANSAASSENQKLRQEIDTLRTERKQVKARIEKLLGQMELL
ncbi:MAG: cell division protein ZapB [Bryobacterales bacterium]|nr:cell division protein ZapB [Bryobacterales bacterium]MBV9397623.1 cell division protein ZapB [Bryobacterales bacterium]